MNQYINILYYIFGKDNTKLFGHVNWRHDISQDILGFGVLEEDNMTDKIKEIVDARGAVYGSMMENGRMSQGLKDQMRTAKNWKNIPPMHREALDMIQHKISRLLNGDYDHLDSWDDIAGYSRVVRDELTKGE